MIPRYFFNAAAAGVCLVVGWQTFQGGGKFLGAGLLLIGAMNLEILIKEIRK